MIQKGDTKCCVFVALPRVINVCAIKFAGGREKESDPAPCIKHRTTQTLSLGTQCISLCDVFYFYSTLQSAESFCFFAPLNPETCSRCISSQALANDTSFEHVCIN